MHTLTLHKKLHDKSFPSLFFDLRCFGIPVAGTVHELHVKVWDIDEVESVGLARSFT